MFRVDKIKCSIQRLRSYMSDYRRTNTNNSAVEYNILKSKTQLVTGKLNFFVI